MDNPIDRLAAELDGLRHDLKEYRQTLHANTATVSINAGGIGIWIASTCAAVSMTMCFAMGGVILNQQREIGELRQYLAAIYMQAPQLKPEESQ